MIITYGENADASPVRGCWWIKNYGGPRFKTEQTYLHFEGISVLKDFLLLIHCFSVNQFHFAFERTAVSCD